jgi:nitrite reductase/ring-hydroxylating ferredoxin subunit
VPWLPAARLRDIPHGRGLAVTVGGRALALFRVGDTAFALEDCCPHRGAPLSEGTVADGEVTCPWHPARFALTTGCHRSPPAGAGVASFPTRVAGGVVEVEVP